jgi:2-dehydropantoate 2-reductase
MAVLSEPSSRLNRPVYVVGAGGIGVAVAWCLARDGCAVTVVEARMDKVSAGRQEGLTVDGRGTVHPSVISFDEWRPSDGALVLLCTKTYDNRTALDRLPKAACLVPVQNGFDPVLEREGHPGEGVASFVSECRRDRPVTRITRPGCLHVGARRELCGGERTELEWLAAALARPGLFPVKWVQDVRPYKAAKLMYNAALSPLAAAAGMDNGELLTDRVARRLFFALLQENYRILRHAGVAAGPNRPVPSGHGVAHTAHAGFTDVSGHFFSAFVAGDVLFHGTGHGVGPHRD